MTIPGLALTGLNRPFGLHLRVQEGHHVRIGSQVWRIDRAVKLRLPEVPMPIKQILCSRHACLRAVTATVAVTRR
jgi:hypothetical protein